MSIYDPKAQSTAVATLFAARLADSEPAPSRKLNVVCVRVHPDDRETGCSVTLARYSVGGHNVTIV